MLTIGIDAANAALTSSGYEVTIDVATRTVSATAALTSAAATPQGVVAPLLFAKENDDLLLWIKFQKNGQNLDLNIHTLAIAIKEFEPDARLVLGDTFTKFGTGTGAYYGLYAAFTGSALAAALSNYEANAGTAFNAIAEIEWQEANPNNVGGFGPIYLRFTTQDFLLKIASDMAQEV